MNGFSPHKGDVSGYSERFGTVIGVLVMIGSDMIAVELEFLLLVGCRRDSMIQWARKRRGAGLLGCGG